MVTVIIVFVVAVVAWAVYGYMKGAPHGLGAEGVKYSMTGLLGMRKLNALIEEKKRAEDSP